MSSFEWDLSYTSWAIKYHSPNQTTESKKEEFRKYLEKTGVIDHLTRSLVGLYEESDKPNNSIDYIKKNLGAPVELDTLKLKSELDRVKAENTKLAK